MGKLSSQYSKCNKCWDSGVVNFIIGNASTAVPCQYCQPIAYVEWLRENPVVGKPTNIILAEQPPSDDVAKLLEAAAVTFRERNAEYKDNSRVVGDVMLALFPKGVELKTAEDFVKFHLFELMIVKLTRYVNSGLNHKDSIHDLGIYAFMVEKETK